MEDKQKKKKEGGYKKNNKQSWKYVMFIKCGHERILTEDETISQFTLHFCSSMYQ